MSYSYSPKVIFPQQHFFYVLKCADNTLYAGYTNNLIKRFTAHNSGKGAKYTKPAVRRPLTILYYEIFATKQEALRQEYAFKKLSRTEKEIYIAQHQKNSSKVL